MVIINAKIYTMRTAPIEAGFLRFDGGKITAVGAMTDYRPAGGEEVLDAAGQNLFPGFIDAHCHIGMWEDALGFEGDDGNEATDPSTPYLRAIDAVNAMDRCFTEAAQAGVTTVLTGPGSANPIGGQWTAMKTLGQRVDDMVLVENIGMKFALGENPKTVYHEKSVTPQTRMATASIIREALLKAKRYLADQQKAAEDEDFDEPDYDKRCEALVPVLKREKKAFFHCHRADDIFTAIRIGKEFDLDYVIVHCTEGYLVADILRQEGVRAICGPFLTDRSKPELRNQTPAGIGILRKAGVPCAICTDHPVIPIQFLPLCAGVAVGAGLDWEGALRSITIDAAEIAGIADHVGSLETGKDADLVLTAGDPFSPYVHPTRVFIGGKPVRA
jgi:imidazolonepropionase-like amidohydrolase